MHALIIPALLLLASLSQRRSQVAEALREGPKPTPPPGGLRPARAKPRPTHHARAMPARDAAPVSRKPPLDVQHVQEHPDVLPAPPQEQAAVDAAMAQVVKEHHAIRTDPYAPPQASPKPAPPMPMPPPELTAEQQKQRAAAQKLLAFLIKTGRFGTLAHDTKSKKDRPAEIKEAQRVLRVSPDGIVGPKTRAAAAAVGVALPERPNK